MGPLRPNSVSRGMRSRLWPPGWRKARTCVRMRGVTYPQRGERCACSELVPSRPAIWPGVIRCWSAPWAVYWQPVPGRAAVLQSLGRDCGLLSGARAGRVVLDWSAIRTSTRRGCSPQWPRSTDSATANRCCRRCARAAPCLKLGLMAAEVITGAGRRANVKGRRCRQGATWARASSPRDGMPCERDPSRQAARRGDHRLMYGRDTARVRWCAGADDFDAAAGRSRARGEGPPGIPGAHSPGRRAAGVADWLAVRPEPGPAVLADNKRAGWRAARMRHAGDLQHPRECGEAMEAGVEHFSPHELRRTWPAICSTRERNRDGAENPRPLERNHDGHATIAARPEETKRKAANGSRPYRGRRQPPRETSP